MQTNENQTNLQKRYVEDLRRMLGKPKPCSLCPTGLLAYPHCVELCTSFVGLPLVTESQHHCPCNQIGSDAIVRAHLAIEQWDNGEHEWQKTGGDS